MAHRRLCNNPYDLQEVPTIKKYLLKFHGNPTINLQVQEVSTNKFKPSVNLSLLFAF